MILGYIMFKLDGKKVYISRVSISDGPTILENKSLEHHYAFVWKDNMQIVLSIAK